MHTSQLDVVLLSVIPNAVTVGVPTAPGGTVGYRANGIVVPDTTVPAAAASLAYAALIDALQAPTVVVVLVSSPSHVVVVEQEVCNRS